MAYIFAAYTSNSSILETSSLSILLKSYLVYKNNEVEALKNLNSIDINESDVYLIVYKLILESRIEKDNEKKLQLLDKALSAIVCQFSGSELIL